MAGIKQETGRGLASIEPLSTSIANTTSEITIYSATIPGGKMGTIKRTNLFIDGWLTTALSLVPTLTVKVKFGTETLTVMNAGVLSIGVTQRPFHIEAYIANTGANNTQFVFATIQQNGQQPAMAFADMSQDTSTDKALVVTVQFGGLSSGTTFQAKYGSHETT